MARASNWGGSMGVMLAAPHPPCGQGKQGGRPPALAPLSLAPPPHPHFHYPSAPPLASARPAESTGMGGGARFVVEKMGFWGGRGGGGGPSAPATPPHTTSPPCSLPSLPPPLRVHAHILPDLSGRWRAPQQNGGRGQRGARPPHPQSPAPPPPSCHSSYGVKNSNSVTLSCGYARVGLMGVTRNHLSKDAQVRILLAANFERDDHASFFLLFLAGETLARRAVWGERERGGCVCVLCRGG